MIFYRIIYVCGRSDGAAGKNPLTPYGPLFFVVYLHILTHLHFKLSSICSDRTTHSAVTLLDITTYDKIQL